MYLVSLISLLELSSLVHLSLYLLDMRLYIADVQQGLKRNTTPIEIVAVRLESTKSSQFIHSTGNARKVKLIVFEHCECK